MQDAREGDRPETDLRFDFVPSWARKPPGVNPYQQEGDGRAASGRRREGPPAGRGRRESRPRGGERGERGGGRSVRPRDEPARRRDRPRPAAPREPRLDPALEAALRVSFVPERKTLGALAHRIRSSGRAFPLMDVAWLFFDNPNALLVKVECAPRAEEGRKLLLAQCRSCQAVFLDAGEAEAHAAAAHLEDVFERSEIEGDPPAGEFTCIGRCRRSGTLLGPPNYHGFNERVQALHRERFADESLDAYRNQIEMLHDPALIERWKEEARRRVVYRRKGEEASGDALSRADAEAWFMKEHLPGLVRSVSRALLPAPVARALPAGPLKEVIREAWNRESGHPFNLSLALRSAFRHMGLHLFKANGNVTFVTAFKPHPVPPDRTVADIAEVLEHLAAHPGCKPAALVAALRPAAAPDAPEARAVLAPLRWLVERGHVVEFFDGALAVPRQGRAG